MCGIVGYFGKGQRSEIEQLVDQLTHRGPDGRGIHVDASVGIYVGHRRLAIRDVERGSQPMTSHEDRYVLSYNGEIYNDDVLRNELIHLGHHFNSTSDTELVLRSLIEWGHKALSRFDGQFAVCFVDKSVGRVLLARDRFGEKPLFWAQAERGLVFSSESSVLASHSWITPRLDEKNCALFLLLGYLPPPYSILVGVNQLVPGCFLDFNLRTMESPTQVRFANPWSEPVAAKDLISNPIMDLQLISEAVNSRRVSDVPVGVLLSGGVDSSLTTTAAARSGWRPEAFTMGFKNSTFDESGFARELAAELGISHTVGLWESPSTDTVLKILGTLDEPLADSSYLPTFGVFQLAKRQTKVLLTGDGGDELFFGYEPFRAVVVSEILRKLMPRGFSKWLSSLVDKIPRTSDYMNSLEVLARFLDGLCYPSPHNVLVWMSTLRTRDWPKFFVSSIEVAELLSDSVDMPSKWSPLESARRFFVQQYLPGSIFSKSDTASMANGVEARTVFLHPSIVSYALGRRWYQEIGWRRGKKSLRRVAGVAGLRDVSQRRKHGFALPLLETLQTLAIDAPRPALTCIRQEMVDVEWKKLRDGKSANIHFLWALVVLVNSRAYRVASGASKHS